MQIGMIRMPPASGLPLFRESLFSTNTFLRQVHPLHLGVDSHASVSLGSNIRKMPKQLFKSFHVNHAMDCAFEVVYSEEDVGWVCLYVKIITDHSDMVISLNAIDYYRAPHGRLLPIVALIQEQYWRTSTHLLANPFFTLVPPLFDRNAVDQEVAHTVDVIEGVSPSWILHENCRKLYDYEPYLLEGVISGRFYRPPHLMFMTPVPGFSVQQDKWTARETTAFRNHVRAGNIHINLREFDTIAWEMVSMRAAQISMTMLLSHALEGLLDLATVRHIVDPYMNVLGTSQQEINKLKQDLGYIVLHSVMLYCRSYGVDPKVFGESRNDTSSITIEKTMADEVSVSIHDLVNDRYVSFYSYFPLIALGTMGAGYAV